MFLRKKLLWQKAKKKGDFRPLSASPDMPGWLYWRYLKKADHNNIKGPK